MSDTTTHHGETPFFQQPIARIVIGVLVFLLVGTARYYRSQHRAERFARNTPVEQQAAPAPVSALTIVPVETVAAPVQPDRNGAFGSTRIKPSPSPTTDYGYRNTPPIYLTPASPRHSNPYGRSQKVPFGQVGHTNLNDPQRLREMAIEVAAFNAANRARREQNAAPPLQPEPFAPPVAPFATRCR